MKKSDFPNDNFRGRLSPQAVERLLEVRNAILAGDPKLYRQRWARVPDGHCNSAGCIFGWLVYLDIVLHGGAPEDVAALTYLPGARILGLHVPDELSWIAYNQNGVPRDRSLAALIYDGSNWPEEFGFDSTRDAFEHEDERAYGAAFIDWVISVYSEANSPAV